jgi:putative colanic acid biosynthesis UDP-glucose lipid carrier transferase
MVAIFARRGMFNHYSWLINRIQWLLDEIVVLCLLAFLSWAFKIEPIFFPHYLLLASVYIFISLIIFRAFHLYRPWRGVNFFLLVRQVSLAWIVCALILIFIGYVSKASNYFSRSVMLTWMVLSPIALIILRIVVYQGLKWARSQGYNSRAVVIAGAGDLGKRLAKRIVDSLSLGMNFLGFFDDNLIGQHIEVQPNNKSFPVLGNLDYMIDYVKNNKVNIVYLALPLRAEARLREIIYKLKDTTASVYFIPDIFVFSLLHATLIDLKGIPMISLWESPFYGINSFLKRAEDLILSSVILILISPLMLLIVLIIKLTSPGPIIFKQRRYGLNGREIIVRKFRTMKVCEDGAEIIQAIQNDKRVTMIGKFLRRTGFDELPQFFNVLAGTMSIVGPRPHAIAHNEFYRQCISGYMLRHTVKPGITGWAQINGWRGETETREKMEGRVELDLEYLSRWSLWFDLKIIFISIFRIFSDKYAY